MITLKRVRDADDVMQAPASSARQRTRTLDLATAAILATMLARIFADPTRINHDCACLLMGAVMVQENRMSLSSLFASMNPPLITYLNVLVARIAVFLGTDVIFVFLLFVFLLVAGSVLTLRRVASGGGLLSAPTAAFVALAWAGTLSVPFAQKDFNFGQREYLVALLLVPYLVGRWRGWEGAPPSRAMKILLGVAAGMGTCLKPHFALVPAVVEGGWILGQRRLSPVFSADVVAYVTTGVAFVAHIFLLPAQLRNAFLGAITETARGYDVYNMPWGYLGDRESIRFALVVGLASVLLLAMYRTAGLRLAGTFGVMALVSVAIYFLQHKGWSYHAIPAYSAGVLTTALLLTRWRFGRAMPSRADGMPRMRRAVEMGMSWLAAVATLLALGNAVTMAFHLARTGIRPVLRTPFHEALAKLSDPGQEILFVTTNVYPMYPALLELGRRPFGRYWGPMMNIAFFQAGLRSTRTGFPYRRMEEMPTAERTFLEQLGRDIGEGRPRLVVVAEGPRLQGCPLGFDMAEYLRRAPVVSDALAPYVAADSAWGYRFLRRVSD
jgi:hypothetical protein